MTVDNFGRLSTVSDDQRSFLSGVTFNNQGMLSQLNLGNGTSETFSYNDRLQMTSQTLQRNTEVLQKYDYSYGQTDLNTGTIDATKNNGQLGKIEGWIGSNKQWSQRFGYDELGRLKEAREYKQGDNGQLTYKQVFDFDRFGNLYRKTANNPTTGQQNPPPYTPIEETDISKATNRFTTDTTYDEAGQVVNDAKFRNMGFAYDANGRMVKATKTGVPDAWTVYDALGNRVATKINDVWQYMIYDAFGKLVAEYGMSSPTSDGIKYVQQDWQGSVRTVTNNAGFVASRTDHQAFGEEIGAAIGLRTAQKGYGSVSPSRQGYGLTEKDDASGQQHTWFRKLETQAGRWSSPDPYKGSMILNDPQSFNRYSYVGNEPTNFFDPSGLVTSVNYSVCGLYITEMWTGESWEIIDMGYACFSATAYFPSVGNGDSGVGGGVTAEGNSPSKDCSELAALIKRVTDELKKRGADLLEDIWKLPPTGKMSIAGHVQQFENKQAHLREALNDFNTQGCGGPGPTHPIPADAWKWATKATPEKRVGNSNPTRSAMAELAAKVGISVAAAYVIYRIARMLPSLAPPLWPTIPANLAIP